MYTFDCCIHKRFCITFVTEQTSQPKVDMFQELLSKHPGVFHPSRTPKSLLVHWQLLKQYYLLDDQSGKLSYLHNYTNITSKHFNMYCIFVLFGQIEKKKTCLLYSNAHQMMNKTVSPCHPPNCNMLFYDLKYRTNLWQEMTQLAWRSKLLRNVHFGVTCLMIELQWMSNIPALIHFYLIHQIVFIYVLVILHLFSTLIPSFKNVHTSLKW